MDGRRIRKGHSGAGSGDRAAVQGLPAGRGGKGVNSWCVEWFIDHHGGGGRLPGRQWGSAGSAGESLTHRQQQWNSSLSPPHLSLSMSIPRASAHYFCSPLVCPLSGHMVWGHVCGSFIFMLSRLSVVQCSLLSRARVLNFVLSVPPRSPPSPVCSNKEKE